MESWSVGVLECWRVGVLECWSVGVLECWRVGVLECWSVRVLECWSVGVLECWSVRVLECWSVGVLECWSVGVLERERSRRTYLTILFPRMGVPPPLTLLWAREDVEPVEDLSSRPGPPSRWALPVSSFIPFTWSVRWTEARYLVRYEVTLFPHTTKSFFLFVFQIMF